MIGYVTLGTNDLARAQTFYDALFATLGATRQWESERSTGWGTSPQAPALAVIKPFDGQPATVGNGVMVALVMPSREAVDAFYAKAIELGATDEGKPGPRGTGGYYGSYFRDPDGNKIAAYHD
ncbi:VOC family protein [Uliginosibacterium paludis]|uniref:VOC family protein n=1 Tax=Uliginosibacterium paludis TaxID=1615952 RepID=A0ABV2CPA6_9RHOO